MIKTLYTLIAFTIFTACGVLTAGAQGGVAINTSGLLPDSSAVLDVSSTTKGVLVPRVTTAQRNAIANPAKGLLVYNTDCDVYNYNAGTPSSPNWVTSNATNSLVAGVSIVANPVGAICEGTNVVFTATPSNGINAPAYQWKVNGNDSGTNSPVFADSLLANGDVVTCILSTSEACVTGSPATSNAITMTVNPIPATPGLISGSTTVCPGFTGNVYSISPVAGATSYDWTVPGDAAITAGAGSTSISVTFGSDSGNVTVAAFNSCGVSTASSLPVTINYTPGSQTFTFTGGEQIFTVPSCVSSVTIAAYGAQGGSQYNNGALGGSATGKLPVTPGEILYVFVGGQNGYNGGGTGNGGCNGGGMSDVRVGGTGIINWVLVAGGGGGGGNNGSSYVDATTGTGGGGGQCANGAAGGAGAGSGTYGGAGGLGTCGAGGAGGNNNGGWGGGGGGAGLTGGGSGGLNSGYGGTGGDGTQGQGGDSGGSTCGCGTGTGAGGGGGGYYGGGGGSVGCCAGSSGGGGSSWASSSMTNLTFFGGVQAGDGEVVITW